MARTVKVDLRGAPPVSGGMRDHIPPGRYRLKVVNVDDGTSKSGKRMFTASYKVAAGENTGANLGDNFVLVDNNNQPSKIGLGRLHHFFLCLGLPVKEAPLSLDLDRLSDLEFEAEINDEKFTDQSGNERISSAVRGYFPARNNGASEVVEPAPEAPAEPAPEPVAVESATEPEPEPAAVEQTTEVETVAAEEVAGEVDDLFK